MKRSYGQYCGVARALDVLGERWTLLVVRELVLGPLRYKDLLDSLPGIGTNLLAARLRDLESEGVVRRRKLPPPAGSTVYELTPLGRELEPIVMALGRWGRKLLAPRIGDAIYRVRWLLFALRTNFVPEKAAGVHDSYEIRIGDEIVHARIDDGRLEVGEGAIEAPDLVLATSLDALFAVASGALGAEAALDDGSIRIDGRRSVYRRFWKLFEPPADDLRAAG